MAASLRGADACFLSNSGDRDRAVAQLGVAPERAQVVRNGIPAAFLGLPVEPSGGTVRLAHVGSWAERKGVRQLAPAVSAVLARRPEVSITYLGTRVAPDVVRAAHDPAARDRVTVVPSFDRAELPALLAGHAIAVTASLAEGFSLALPEVMACGLAPVATALDGAREIVTDGENGVLVAPGDAARWSARSTRWRAIASGSSGCGAPRTRPRRSSAGPPWPRTSSSATPRCSGGARRLPRLLRRMTAPDPAQPIAATVVIATRDRHEGLRQVLGALARQDGRRRFEAVVVDDGSTPPVGPADLAALPGARLLQGGGRGPARARNAGLAAATAPVVLFTDDDTIPSPGWVDAALGYLEAEPDAAGVEGPIVSLPYDRLYELSLESTGPGAYYTANVAYRRAVLEAIDGFDARFPYPHCEDLDLAFRAERHGRIGFAEDMRMEHVPRPATLREMVRRGRYSTSELGAAAPPPGALRARGVAAAARCSRHPTRRDTSRLRPARKARRCCAIRAARCGWRRSPAASSRPRRRPPWRRRCARAGRAASQPRRRTACSSSTGRAPNRHGAARKTISASAAATTGGRPGMSATATATSAAASTRNSGPPAGAAPAERARAAPRPSPPGPSRPPRRPRRRRSRRSGISTSAEDEDGGERDRVDRSHGPLAVQGDEPERGNLREEGGHQHERLQAQHRDDVRVRLAAQDHDDRLGGDDSPRTRRGGTAATPRVIRRIA